VIDIYEQLWEVDKQSAADVGRRAKLHAPLSSNEIDGLINDYVRLPVPRNLNDYLLRNGAFIGILAQVDHLIDMARLQARR
jgi:hypothetical protein